MRRLSQSRGANFIFLYDDFQSCNKPSHNLQDFDLIGDLKKSGVQVVRTSKVYQVSGCSEKDLRISHDGHPTALANSLIADYLHFKGYI